MAEETVSFLLARNRLLMNTWVQQRNGTVGYFLTSDRVGDITKMVMRVWLR